MTQASRRGFLGGLLATAAIAASGAKVLIPTPAAAQTVGEAGWLVCNGQAVSRSAYSKLFEAIGTTYGGDEHVFKLPDMRATFSRVVTERAVNPVGEFVYAIQPTEHPVMPVGQVQAFYVPATS
jgi:hypothetical protein